MKSSCIMIEYLGEPEKTAQMVDKDGWLHTGDLAEIDAQGNIRIRGRQDDVIISPTGENIYPAEIEAVLVSSPLILDVMVFNLPGDPIIKVAIYPDMKTLKVSNKEQLKKALWSLIQEKQLSLATYKRIKSARDIVILDKSLPKTSTLDTKRKEAMNIIKGLL